MLCLKSFITGCPPGQHMAEICVLRRLCTLTSYCEAVLQFIPTSFTTDRISGLLVKKEIGQIQCTFKGCMHSEHWKPWKCSGAPCASRNHRDTPNPTSLLHIPQLNPAHLPQNACSVTEHVGSHSSVLRTIQVHCAIARRCSPSHSADHSPDDIQAAHAPQLHGSSFI